MENTEEIQRKIDALFQFRNALDENEKELFDILLEYANEVALSIDGCGVHPQLQGF